MRPLRLALVLGAGGLVGVAHHAGVVAALADEIGFVEERADVVIGTSAGSAIAAYLRTGWPARSLMERACDLGDAALGQIGGGVLGLVRHGVGSAYVVARASVRVPSVLSVSPAPLLRRAFPAGVVTMSKGSSILDRELPRNWPERPLWLCTYDLIGRRRVVLGRPGEPYLPVAQAVRASCAIPGIYAPVRVADGVLVDGGAWSLINLDLTSLALCDTVICVAPMCYDPLRPPSAADRVMRAVPTRALARASARLRRQGISVVMLAPGPREVAAHGLNLMRSRNLETVAEVAYAETVTELRRLGAEGALGGLAG